MATVFTTIATRTLAPAARSAFLKSKFPEGQPGTQQSRTLGNNLVLGKVDYLIDSSNTLSTFFNYSSSSGERAIQTPIVLPNVGRNGTDDVRIHAYARGDRNLTP